MTDSETRHGKILIAINTELDLGKNVIVIDDQHVDPNNSWINLQDVT